MKKTTSDKSLGDTLNIYLKEINNINLLSEEEEKALGIRIKKYHDNNAIKELVKHNLRFAFKIAKRYSNKGIPLEDLVEYANLSLFSAARNFDYEKGRFTTYASYWINQILKEKVYKNAQFLNVPDELCKLIFSIEGIKYKLYSLYGYDADDEEISKYLNVSLEQVKKAIQANYKVISLDKRIDGNNYVADLVSDTSKNVEEEAIFSLEKEDIKKAIDTLPKLEKKVISLKYGINFDREYQVSEIASILNITRRMVDCALERAYLQLRNDERFVHLKEYIEIDKFSDNKKRQKNKTLYQMLSDVSEDKNEINNAISKLSDEDKEVIDIIYGSDLDNPVKDKERYSKDVYNHLYRRVIPRIKRKIKKK